MWVRKSQEEIQALKPRRYSLWGRLNPLMPLLWGLGGSLVAFLCGLMGARGPLGIGTPLPYEPNTVWAAFKYYCFAGFVSGFLVAYVMQMVLGTLNEPPPLMCPRCWKVKGQFPLCECGVPWEPIDWWKWIPVEEQNPKR